MSLNITNLFYSEKEIGATIKLTKRQFIWEFDLNGSSQHIELLDSRFSGKKRLFKNGVNLLTTTEKGNFMHNFEIGGVACVIIQYGDKIELRINNQSFTHLYNLQKNKQMFAGEKGPTSNTYVAKSYSGFNSSEDNSNQNNDAAFYKVSKPENENKPKLFNFEIKKDGLKKSHEFKSKFTFGEKKDSNSSFQNKNSFNDNNNNSSNNNSNSNNNGNMDLLGFQDQDSNYNNNNNNNNPFDFGNDNNSNINNQSNMNNQNQQKTGNDIFDLFANNNNNQNNNNQPNNNNQNNNNGYNYNFLALSDGTNQQPVFDQNNLGFMNLNNNNMNNNANNNNMNMMNNNANNNNMNMMNNNFNNNQNQQMNQGFNQNNNNNGNNQQNNNLNFDFLNF